MLDVLLVEQMAPFTISLTILIAIFCLELVTMLLGFSLMGDGDADVDFDVDAGVDVDLDMDSGELLDLLASEAEGAEMVSASAPASFLGFGKVPFLIWLSALLATFGVTGFVVQNVLNTAFGFMLPAGLAAIPAVFGALVGTGFISGVLGRLVPKIETTAVSVKSLHRLRGVVTQGVASRGRPAEVRVQDKHGNLHYIHVEPFGNDDVINEGSEVLVIKNLREKELRIVQLSDQI